MFILNEWIEIIVVGFLGLIIEKAIVWVFTKTISNILFIILLSFALAVSFSKVYEISFLTQFQPYHNLIIGVSSGYFLGVLFHQLNTLIQKTSTSDKIVLLQIISVLFRAPTFVIAISSVLRYLYNMNDFIEYKFIVIVALIDLIYSLLYIRLKRNQAKIDGTSMIEALAYITLFMISMINFSFMVYLVVRWIWIDNFEMVFMDYILLIISFTLSVWFKRLIYDFRNYLFGENN